MQEFRPASVIEADSALAVAFRAGDDEAIRTIAERYGAPVTALAVRLLADEEQGRSAAVEVFVEARRISDRLEPGSDFAPWLASITDRVARQSGAPGHLDDDEVARTWVTAAATSRLSPVEHDALRAFNVEGVEPADEAAIAAEQVRLERRLAHLSAGPGSLSDPLAWITPDPLLPALVADAVRAERRDGAATEIDRPSVVAGPRASIRAQLRPAVIGVGAALAVLLAAIVVLSAVSGSPEEEDVRGDLVSTGLLADVEGGEIVVTARDTGLQIELDAPTLPRRGGDSFYSAVLLLDDDSAVTVGSFNEGIDVTLWSGVPLDRVRSFRVVEADIADPEPTTDPTRTVLKADIVAR